MTEVTNCCECVRSVRDKITLELDALWTHLKKLEHEAKIGLLLKTLFDRLVNVIVMFMLVVIPIIIVIFLDYVVQDTKESKMKRISQGTAACLIGIGALIGVPLFLIHIERFIQARSQLDLLMPSAESSRLPHAHDRGAAGDRTPDSDDEWETDEADSEQSWSAGEVSEIAGETGEGFTRQTFYNYD